VLIALVTGIVVGLPLPAAVEEGFRNNLMSLTALPGFLVSMGALAVNRNFAMTLGLVRLWRTHGRTGALAERYRCSRGAVQVLSSRG
jgi:hypothetical protein